MELVVISRATCNPGHKILEFYNILGQIRWPQIKENLISSIANFVYKLSHKLPSNLRLRILGNKEILEKPQIWVDTVKTDTKLFFYCPVLLDHSILFQMICLGLPEQGNFLYLPGPVSFQLQFFDIFNNSKAFLWTSAKI